MCDFRFSYIPAVVHRLKRKTSSIGRHQKHLDVDVLADIRGSSSSKRSRRWHRACFRAVALVQHSSAGVPTAKAELARKDRFAASITGARASDLPSATLAVPH